MQKFKNIFLQNGDLKQTTFKNIFWLSISHISRILRIIILLLAARVLGASEYGTFSYILGLVGIFSIFADLGINPLLTRDTSQEKNKEGEYFVTSFWIKMGLITLTSGIFFIFAPELTNISAAIYLVPLAALLIIFENLRDFIIAYLRGIQKMEYEAIIMVALNIVLSILGLTALLKSPSAYNFFFVYVLSSAFSVVVALIIARDSLSHIWSGFRRSIAKEMLQNGWPIAISGIFGLVMANIDIFMLGLWRSTTEIGLYSAGQKIIQVLYALPALLASGVFPATAIYIKNAEKAQEKGMNEKSFSIVFLFAIPVVVGGIILAEPIFKLLFGHDYTGGVLAFSILLLGTLFAFPGLLLSNLALAHNKQKTVFKYIAIGSLLNVLLNFFLIPKFGILGAAIALLVSQKIIYYLSWSLISKVSEFRILTFLPKIIVSATLMGFFSFFLNFLGMHVLLNIGLSALLYLSLLWLLGEVTLRSTLGFLGDLRQVE